MRPLLVNVPSPWSVLIFRLAGRDVQQQLLRVIHEREDPGMLALGIDRGDECFIVIDTSLATEAAARHLVIDIDPTATCVQSSRSPDDEESGWAS